MHSAIFRPGARELITCGDAGVQRWPLLDRTDGSRSLQFGPPQRIPLPLLPTRATCSHDGRLLAVVSESVGGALVLDLAAGKLQTILLPHPASGFVALSLDGAWLATSGWRSPVTRFWNVGTGKMIEEWKAAPLGSMSFTPDSRTLIATHADHFNFCDVQTLQPVRRLPRGGATYTSQVAVSTDGKMIALEVTPGIIHFTETATGRTVARLTDPTGDRAT